MPSLGGGRGSSVLLLRPIYGMNTNVDMAEGTLAEGGGEGRPRFPASRQNRETGKHGLARRGKPARREGWEGLQYHGRG